MPEIGPYFQFYIDAFYDLTTCRYNGMSTGPIPFTAMIEYAKIYDIVGDDLVDFLHVMRVMDNAFLNKVQEKEKSHGKRDKGNSNKGPSNRGKRP